jgi:hypothetical protein
MIETPKTCRPDESRARPARPVRLGATSAGLCGLVLALTTSCAQNPTCSELGTCGGNPVGDWVLAAGHPSCSEQLYRAPIDPRLAKGDQPAARLPLPEESLYDWCDALIFKTDDPNSVDSNHLARFSVADQTVGAAWIHYDGAGNYAALLTKTGTYVAEYPSGCVRAFGAMDDATGGGVCTQVQAYLAAKSSVGRNIACVSTPNDPTGGCTCRFSISIQSGGSGTYKPASSNTIVHQLTARFPDKSQAADFPSYATFCNKGTSLQLTGADGGYLFNEPGLRTLDLQATTINCTDGIKGPGEDGVDCGVACPMPCP